MDEVATHQISSILDPACLTTELPDNMEIRKTLFYTRYLLATDYHLRDIVADLPVLSLNVVDENLKEVVKNYVNFAEQLHSQPDSFDASTFAKQFLQLFVIYARIWILPLVRSVIPVPDYVFSLMNAIEAGDLADNIENQFKFIDDVLEAHGLSREYMDY